MAKRIDLEHGKYAFLLDEGTWKLSCLRHGKEWRSHEFVGDKAIHALFLHAVLMTEEVEFLRKLVGDLKEESSAYERGIKDGREEVMWVLEHVKGYEEALESGTIENPFPLGSVEAVLFENAIRRFNSARKPEVT